MDRGLSQTFLVHLHSPAFLFDSTSETYSQGSDDKTTKSVINLCIQVLPSAGSADGSGHCSAVLVGTPPQFCMNMQTKMVDLEQ